MLVDRDGVTHGLWSTGQNNVWQSEWLHMLINVINQQGQKCHMIDGGGGFRAGGGYDRDEIFLKNINIWKIRWRLWTFRFICLRLSGV